MVWVKLDDGFTEHPKVVQAGVPAAWLFLAGLGYCARHLTDGLIPEAEVRRLTHSPQARRQADRLLAVGLWERAPGGYRVHDYLEYQPSAAQVKAERRAAAERKARWRGVPDGVRDAVTPTVPDAVRPASPSRKIPEGDQPAGRRDRDGRGGTNGVPDAVTPRRRVAHTRGGAVVSCPCGLVYAASLPQCKLCGRATAETVAAG